MRADYNSKRRPRARDGSRRLPRNELQGGPGNGWHMRGTTMGKIFRSVLAVLAGYLLMAVLVVIVDGILMMAFGPIFMGPDGKPRMPDPVAPWYALNLVYSFLFAIAAGYLTTLIAR